MLKPTPAERRAAFMRTVRRADYDRAKMESEAAVLGRRVKVYERAVNARTSRPVMTPIDMGAGMVIVLPLHYKKS